MPWHKLLDSAIAGSSKAAVARSLGVSRTAISLLASGKYPGGTDAMAKRIEDVFGRVRCPYLDKELSQAECRNKAEKMPTSSPAALRLWKACQGCEYNPVKEGVEK